MVNPNSNQRGLSAVANAFCDRSVVSRSAGRNFSWLPISLDECDAGSIIAAQQAAITIAILEALEARQLMSVSLDGSGFTVVTPAADSRIIYVSSSSGSDSNSGLSAGKAVRTLEKGIDLIRDGSADQLLLKRGDTWRETFGRWTKSGRSPDEPILISAYGIGNRPLIRSGTDDGIGIGSASAENINHLAIVGIHFWADGRDPNVAGYNKYSLPYGINVIAGGSGLLIEDVKVEKYMTNIAFTPYLGEMKNVTIRRSIITDAYEVGNSHLHAQGLFADGVRGLTLEQNTFDHNGWLETVSGAKATLYNHNAYVTASTTGLVAKGNIFANASSHGLQARPGGVIKGNLFLNNPIGLSYGLVNGSGVTTKGGVWGEVSDNVFLGSRDIDGLARGIGIQASNIKPGTGTHFSRNIFANYQDSTLPAMVLEYGLGSTQADAVGINDLTLRDNVVYKWARGLIVSGDMSPTAVSYKRLKNVVLATNKFSQLSRSPLQNHRYLSVDGISGSTTAASYFSAPDRTLATYNKSLGGYSADWQFMVAVRDRLGGDWDGQYSATAAVNYVRGGFGLYALAGGTAIPPVVPPPAPPPAAPPAVPPAVPPVVPPTTPHPPLDVGEKVPKADAAVRVKAFKFAENRKAQKLIVKFSRDVVALDVTDLTLTPLDGQQVDTSNMTLEWNAKKRKAVWSVPGQDAARIAKGKYTAALFSSRIVDDQGRNLDGNGDRVGGDVFTRTLKVKRG